MNLPIDYINRMKLLLSEKEFNEYLLSLAQDSKKAISLNTNYLSSITEIDLGFETKSIPNFENAFFHDVEKIGNTVHYLTGAFYPQEALAMLPILSFEFEKDWKCLDLCAAPGGKTILLANQVKNGYVISNEIDFKRSKILYANIERLGLKNVIITQNKAEDLSRVFSNHFDCILVDAPCSGEGMFKKESIAIEQWSEKLVNSCQKLDFTLVEEAHKMLKNDGVLIYSTCTFSMEENEEVIQYLINKYHYEIIKPKDFVYNITKAGINIEEARRCYPFLFSGHGQFFCGLRKKTASGNSKLIKPLIKKNNKIVDSFINENLLESVNYFELNQRIYSFNIPIDLTGLNVVSYGVYLGNILKNCFVPNHFFFKAYGYKFKNKLFLKKENELIKKYLRGEEIVSELNNGYGVLFVDNIPLGGFKTTNNHLKNHYPKCFRRQYEFKKNL